MTGLELGLLAVVGYGLWKRSQGGSSPGVTQAGMVAVGPQTDEDVAARIGPTLILPPELQPHAQLPPAVDGGTGRCPPGHVWESRWSCPPGMSCAAVMPPPACHPIQANAKPTGAAALLPTGVVHDHSRMLVDNDYDANGCRPGWKFVSAASQQIASDSGIYAAARLGAPRDECIGPNGEREPPYARGLH